MNWRRFKKTVKKIIEGRYVTPGELAELKNRLQDVMPELKAAGCRNDHSEIVGKLVEWSGVSLDD